VGRVEVLSATVLRFIMPPFAGDPSRLKSGPVNVDVQVVNIYPDGTPVQGESVTRASFFRYYQKDLAKEAHVTAVDRALIDSLRIGVLDNVAFSTDPDYVTPDGVQFHVYEDAGLPALYVSGPRTTDPIPPAETADSKANDGDVVVKAGGAQWQRTSAPMIAVAHYNVVGVSNSRMECTNLAQAFLEWTQAVKVLRVPIDPTDVSKGYREYALALEKDGQPDVGKYGDLHQFSAQILIDGVQVLPEEGFIQEEGNVIFDGTDKEWRYGFPSGWLIIERKEN